MSDSRPRLHFIAKHKEYAGNLRKSATPGCLDIGNWAVTHSIADRAVSTGAELHLHEGQDQQSWKSGIVVGWFESTEFPGRIVFTFSIDKSLQKKQLSGWGREKSYVGF